MSCSAVNNDPSELKKNNGSPDEKISKEKLLQDDPDSSLLAVKADDVHSPALKNSRDEKISEEKLEDAKLDLSLSLCNLPSDLDTKNDIVLELLKGSTSPGVSEMVSVAYHGLNAGRYPIRTSTGAGGSYFMQDSAGNKCAVFKPEDEEPHAADNPWGLARGGGAGVRRGTVVGEGAIREFAAYLVDHERFAGVPVTCYIKCSWPGVSLKIGSLQRFVSNEGSCDDFGPGLFTVDEMQKIFILDLRLGNTDRHFGNLLVRQQGDGVHSLVPIDHGYCLPHSMEDFLFDWMSWRQAKKTFSTKSKDYIKSLNAICDIDLLSSHGFVLPPECAKVFLVTTTLLQKSCSRGLSPYQIGNIACRRQHDKPSVIELLVQEADSLHDNSEVETSFLDQLSLVLDKYLKDFVA